MWSWIRSSPALFAPSRSGSWGHAGPTLRGLLAKTATLKLFGKSPAGIYLRLNKWLWDSIPIGVRNFYPIRAYGTWLHGLVQLTATRRQYFGTFFLRNRPALELMRRIADGKANGSTLRIAVLECSIGADVDSILWTIRMEQMFDWEDQKARVKPWLREGITWRLGDASSPELIDALGRQDIVVANNFLCHMEPPAAESCLRNIAGLVDREGYLFVSGIDLEIRTRVARELRWQPVSELLEQIHDGDYSVREDWPWCCWALSR